MATLVTFEGRSPRVDPSAYIAPTAVLIGDVEVGPGASILFGAVLRADLGPIRVGKESNIQDNCVVHAETKEGTVLGERVTVGHGAVLHDCHLKDRSLIGMLATILHGTIIGEETLVAANSLVREGSNIPPRRLVAGVPAVIKKELDGQAAEWVARGADDYVKLNARYRAGATVQIESRRGLPAVDGDAGHDGDRRSSR